MKHTITNGNLESHAGRGGKPVQLPVAHDALTARLIENGGL